MKYFNLYRISFFGFFISLNLVGQPSINTFGSDENDTGCSLIETPEGDILILGTVQSPENGSQDILLIK